MQELVAGVDGCKNGWVAVLLLDGKFHSAHLVNGVKAPFAELSEAVRIAIDVPIGYGPCKEHPLAPAIVGGSSVFVIFAKERLEAQLTAGGGISALAHALGPRIRHVTAPAARDGRSRESHPELCFIAMNAMRRLGHAKKTAAGAFERLSLLRRYGIMLDEATLGTAENVLLDDLLVAAACAWTAACKNAASLPDLSEDKAGLAVKIWYRAHSRKYSALHVIELNRG